MLKQNFFKKLNIKVKSLIELIISIKQNQGLFKFFKQYAWAIFRLPLFNCFSKMLMFESCLSPSGTISRFLVLESTHFLFHERYFSHFDYKIEKYDAGYIECFFFFNSLKMAKGFSYWHTSMSAQIMQPRKYRLCFFSF